MLGFVRNMLKWGVARWSDAAATGLMQPNGVVAQFPKIFKFPDFSPSLLASLVAGATYGQSGTTVTVAATGHGLPTIKNGYRIFWPGSALVPAGWYANFQYVDANTFTFDNPTSQTVAAGTALTATLPYVTSTAIASVVLPAGTLGTSGCIALKLAKSGDALSANKYSRLDVAGVTRNSALVTASSAMVLGTQSAMIHTVGGSSYTIGGSFGGMDGITNTGANQYRLSINLNINNNVVLAGMLGSASSWVSFDAAFLEVTP